MMHSQPWYKSVVDVIARTRKEDACLGHTTALSFLFLLSFFISPHSSLVQLTFFLLWMLNQIINQRSSPSLPAHLNNKTVHQFPVYFSLKIIKITLFIQFVILLPVFFFLINFYFPHSELIWSQPTSFSCSSRTYPFPLLLSYCCFHKLLKVSVARNDNKEEERTVCSRLLSLLKLVKKANFLVNGRRSNLWLALPNYKHELPSAAQRQLSKCFNIGKNYIFFYF